ncbi:DUF805 domain-containing protein [Aeromonas rivuli]|uniref:DUF805 domain-containing protein n=1 Tax=Aeromonas rivuli TaxID=648794 RepID=UPI001CCCDF3A|nr:DUF805 domain-containing protein [Aeromonas rivuli]UBO75265.1 DUF805 domain-containing protein [Aeromonas rivuli]
MAWYLTVMKKYAVFSGRARRKEYWMFVLCNLGIALVLSLLGQLIGLKEQIANLYSLVVLLPSLAVGVRRLHDTDRCGWWLLINLIPVVGTLVFLYFMVCEGEAGPNRFGEDPKAGLSAAATF